VDRIIIDNLKIYAHHGVNDFEKRDGQNFFVSATLFLDTRIAGKSDDLHKTINYAQVCEFIDKFMQGNTFDLIETVAERLAGEILHKFQNVQGVELEVKKPDAPVELEFENISVKIFRKWHRAYLGIGSNMGDKSEYLDMAVQAIEKSEDCRLLQVSDFIVTNPVGDVKQDDFLNGCVELDTLLSPEELLGFTNGIEQAAGRTREIHWGPRALDVDILLYDDLVTTDSKLVIPHHEMHKREFVLKPLSQIAPYAVHPILNERVIDMLEKLKKINLIIE